ncbi:MAG: cobalamin biosynthesis protein CbiX [Pseudomonadota bacterium]|jgi:sirohydrochlorin cobaltochelatase
MTDSVDTLILFAHGARDPLWRLPADALAERLRGQLPDARIDVAFLEFMQPTLPEAIDAAVAAGARRVSIAPLFWAEGGHLRREVPELIADCQARHPDLEIDRWPVLGDSAEVLEALSEVYGRRWRMAGAA